jgi:hypothetical protein
MLNPRERHRLPNPLADQRRTGFVSVGQKHDKFIAAITCRDVARPENRILDRFTNLPQAIITGQMAVAIVELRRAPRTGGHLTWGDSEIAKYRKAHQLGTVARVALELMLNVAARRGDACRLGRRHVTKDGRALLRAYVLKLFSCRTTGRNSKQKGPMDMERGQYPRRT